MDQSKVFVVISAFLLMVCLALSVTSIGVLRKTMTEDRAIKEDARQVLAALDERLSPAVPVENGENETDAAALVMESDCVGEVFYLRDTNGKVGIYTSDGYLIRILDVAVNTLPDADQSALRDGIRADSRAVLAALIQDFSS